MNTRVERPPRTFLQRHPLLRDALLWAIPALLFGAALRLLFLSYSPYAYWGSDSKSYFSFAEQLLGSGKISLYDKRRYVYPIFLLPVTALPGPLLSWLAWIQHGLGVLTLIPLAYCVRKGCVHWRWVIIPVTVLYAGIPMILWYEHELLAETIFFASVVWTCAGWMAWVSENNPARKLRLWWYFFAPLCVLLLTKPAGRFILPGIILALIVVKAWRHLRWKEAAGLAAAAALTFTIGQDSQGAWLLYTSSFPLTRLDTPLHAEYKAEVRDMVLDARARLDSFKVDEDRDWKAFLKFPDKQKERQLWHDLGKDEDRKARVYKELAMEGIRSRPDLFLLISGVRILSSANPDDFKAERFLTDYSPRKTEHIYERFLRENPDRLRMILGLSAHQPIPPFSEYRHWLEPRPNSAAAQWLYQYAQKFEHVLHLIDDQDLKATEAGKILPLALRPAGWLLLIGALLSLWPTYFRLIGVWTILISGYLIGVFLVGSANARFFGVAWPIAVLLMALPLDCFLRAISATRRRFKPAR
jgi:hypothetical protein